MATKVGCSPMCRWREWCRWGWVRAGQRDAEEAGEPEGELGRLPGKGSGEETQKDPEARRHTDSETEAETGRYRRTKTEVDSARQSGGRRAGRSRAAWRWRERPTCVW